jgi:uncharacterized protein (DUF1778 family)
MSTASQARTKRIHIRVTPREDRLIRTGAKVKQVDVTDFVVSSACLEAEHALADQRHFVLSARAWKEFTEALDRSPQIKPRLRRLFSEPSVIERRVTE